MNSRRRIGQKNDGRNTSAAPWQPTRWRTCLTC